MEKIRPGSRRSCIWRHEPDSPPRKFAAVSREALRNIAIAGSAHGAVAENGKTSASQKLAGAWPRTSCRENPAVVFSPHGTFLAVLGDTPMNVHCFRSFLSKFGVLAVCLAAVSMQAQTYTESVISSFPCTEGCSAEPAPGLILGTDGNLYGAAEDGGAHTYGALFKLTTSGTLTTLYSFCSEGGSECTDGEYPQAGVVQGTNGDFYGTTTEGGSYNGGTLFSISSSGVLTTLHFFCSQGGTACSDGEYPKASLLPASNGNLYGTTSTGGSGDAGTLFSITPSGTFTTLYSFCSQTLCADGVEPEAALIFGKDGNLYGTTLNGGANHDGTVFKITTSGVLTRLYSFCNLADCADGASPAAAVTQGKDGNFYGTTNGGGQYNTGTVFQLTPSGALTTLYSFCCSGDIASPAGGLVQGANGNFFGLEAGYGSGPDPQGEAGSIYEITTTGALAQLYYFCSQTDCTDGAFPVGGLVQDSAGNFYGATTLGGASGIYGPGTVFKYGPTPKATSDTTVAVSPNPASVGQMVSLTATVSGSNGTPTGSITFSVDGASIGSATLNSSGVATMTASSNGIAPGTYPIVATYAGNTSYSTSQSSALDVLLNKAFTATTLTASPTSVTSPASVTLTAKVTRSATGATGTPGGTVTFSYKTETLGTTTVDSSGVATLAASSKGIPDGSYAITAAYNGDTNDATSTSSPVTVTVK